ncbi:bifunctional phosphoglucose/phosphomannose isomerase, partial [Chloroflexota bacterium]
MVNLDDLSIYPQFDKSGMLNQLSEFPKECRRAWQKAIDFALPAEYARVDKVVILGMGGSAIGGEMVSRLLLESKALIWIVKDYDLPPFVDEKTLVIASSYSGNTEETLSAFTDSLKTKARKLVLTTGGKLKKLADKQGIPTFLIDYQAPPRVAFPHSFIPLVGIFQKLGLVKDKTGDLQETLPILNKLVGDLAATTPLNSNEAKQLATKLWGRIVIVYGVGILSAITRRWKSQLNENSKSWAFFELFPELNHNSTTGFQFPHEAKERIFVLLLRSPLIHPRNLLRYEATSKLLDKACV